MIPENNASFDNNSETYSNNAEHEKAMLSWMSGFMEKLVSQVNKEQLKKYLRNRDERGMQFLFDNIALKDENYKLCQAIKEVMEEEGKIVRV